jgi:DNA-directed DNA polymerase III PolC
MYLNCHSYFSFRYGTISPKELVDEAKRLRITTLCLTDINNTSAVFDFIRFCRSAGIKPIIGIQFRHPASTSFIALAKNGNGFREINEYLSRHTSTAELAPFESPHFREAYVIYNFNQVPERPLQTNEFIGIRIDEVNKLFTSPLRTQMHKLVILHPATFQNKEYYKLHKMLVAIDKNCVYQKVPDNAIAHDNEYLLPEKQLLKYYDSYPEIIENTKTLLNSCSIKLDLSSPKTKLTFTGSMDGDEELLVKLANDGLKSRYGNYNVKAQERMHKELTIIRKMGFMTYFLITWDIIRYAKMRGFRHVGRGSGANSIVAYCLQITDVEPLELDLYFERFINEFRVSPPDFDIDFSYDQRDEVLDYIFKRYRKEHAAFLPTYSTFRGRSIIRELGKVFGLPKHDIDLIIHRPDLKDQHHALAKHINKYARMMVDFPNYLSMHPGGVLISEEPINQYSSQKMMPDGFAIVHFDMHVAEHIGYFKFDILSQRGLGHIKEAAEIIYENHGNKIDIDDVETFKRCPDINRQLKQAKTIGCFYIESPAMRQLLAKLRCSDYKSLIAASSIIRPGVAQSGMMQEYIRRFHNPAGFKYIHAVFEEHLSETYGVMVYQEDVIKIAHHFAGLGLAESDVLRRMMSGKRKAGDRLDELKKKYFKNCRERGYSDELASEVWRQIESFAGYSFCKAHSASFAVESYQSLFLKTHYPLEFITAVINNEGGFYRREIYLHEAKSAGASIHLPCINTSRYKTRIIGKDIYLGLNTIEHLEYKLACRIVNQRERQQFKNLNDLVKRTQITAEQLNLLTRSGALRFTGKSKQQLLWEKNYYLNPDQKKMMSLSLFEEPENEPIEPFEIDEFHDVLDEIALFGFPVTKSPFELVEIPDIPLVPASEMKQHEKKQVYMLGYYVCQKDTVTKHKDRMTFGCFLDSEGSYFDTIHFPDVFRKYRFQGISCYLLKGKVIVEFDFPSLQVTAMKKLPYKF